MTGKYHDRFSKAIAELEDHNAYVCTTCNGSMQHLNQRDQTRHAEHAEKQDLPLGARPREQAPHQKGRHSQPADDQKR